MADKLKENLTEEKIAPKDPAPEDKSAPKKTRVFQIVGYPRPRK